MTMETDIPASWNTKYAFTASMSISTSEWSKSHQTRRSNIYSDVTPLSLGLTKKLLKRDNLLSDILQDTLGDKERPTSSLPTHTPKEQPNSKFATEIKKANSKMDEWIFDRRAIIVRCDVYVWTWAVCALLLVIGGLVIGFCLGNRVRGVDPFNITVRYLLPFVWSTVQLTMLTICP